MERFFWHMRGALPTLFLGAMVCAVLTVAGITAPESPTAIDVETKATLMAHLDEVDDAACDPAGLYLFADNTPLMVVWMASEPAELYSAAGDFVGQLSIPELTRLINTTRPFAERCLGQDTEAAPEYSL